MKDRLKQIETPYVDAQTLIALFHDYRKPRDCILRLVKNRDLIRLKNGFYLIADKIQEGAQRVIPYEQIANMLYGPSYVSLEWALSFYGMIPERVYTVTSMALGRSKQYDTPVGAFAYHRLSEESYSIGITQKKAADFVGGFLMASPEKALADLVYVTCRGLDKDELKLELLESKRIDREALLQLDKGLLAEIAKRYSANRVEYLSHLIGEL